MQYNIHNKWFVWENGHMWGVKCREWCIAMMIPCVYRIYQSHTFDPWRAVLFRVVNVCLWVHSAQLWWPGIISQDFLQKQREAKKQSTLDCTCLLYKHVRIGLFMPSQANLCLSLFHKQFSYQTEKSEGKALLSQG